ncbi:hypothetical protein Tco_1528748 [Tanacetum coccineum]
MLPLTEASSKRGNQNAIGVESFRSESYAIMRVESIRSEICGGNGGRGGSMETRGGGWLAKRSIVSNEGCGGGGLAVRGGTDISEIT